MFPNDLVATVEIGGGAFGSWGRVPADWEWALVCARAASSGPLVDAPAEEVTARLWDAARAIDARLFRLEDADVVQLIRWRHAVPTVGPGYFGRHAVVRPAAAARLRRRLARAAVRRGAVRAGNAAAAACFPRAAGR